MRKQGRSQKAFVCAVIFLAHKNLNISIRYKELVKIFNVKSRDVYKIITLLSSTIKKTNKRQNTNLRNYFQKEIINKHFQGMFSDSVVFKGTRIAYVLEKMLNGNYNPLTVSSGICYYLIKIENVKVDQKALAKKLGVSDYAIRKWYYHIKTKVLYRP